MLLASHAPDGVIHADQIDKIFESSTNFRALIRSLYSRCFSQVSIEELNVHLPH